MRKTMLALAVAGALVSGCVDVPVDWPKVVECGAAADTIFGDVARILTSDGTAEEMGEAAIAALEKLARERGHKAVACIVETLVEDWLSPGASPDPVRLAGAQRGRDFLESRGVERVELEYQLCSGSRSSATA